MKNAFSEHLKQCRVNAGYKTLAEVVAVATKSHKNMPSLSKAKLSLYERGGTDTLKPEILRLLAAIYHVSYDELAWRWFSERYGTSTHKRDSLNYTIHDGRVLKIESAKHDISLLSLKLFEREQSKVPVGTYVLVSAPRFLDDTVFFDMVLSNLKKGVTYLYLLPESQRVNYRHLISRIGIEAAELADSLDGIRTYFIPRSDFDTPINQVLFLLPSGEVRGYVGLLDGEEPVCYQFAAQRFALQLFHAFLWNIRVAFNGEISQGIKKLEGFYAMEQRENCEMPIELVRQTFRTTR